MKTESTNDSYVSDAAKAKKKKSFYEDLRANGLSHNQAVQEMTRQQSIAANIDTITRQGYSRGHAMETVARRIQDASMTAGPRSTTSKPMTIEEAREQVAAIAKGDFRHQPAYMPSLTIKADPVLQKAQANAFAMKTAYGSPAPLAPPRLNTQPPMFGQEDPNHQPGGMLFDPATQGMSLTDQTDKRLMSKGPY